MAGILCTVIWAGTPVKKRAAEYPVSASTSKAALGFEFHGRSLPGEDESYLVADYLVVEAAVFPLDGPEIAVQGADFRLRLNGAKLEMLPQVPGVVAGALSNRGLDWNRGVTASGGIGPGVVVIGQPRPTERFPDDPQARRPYPNPPRAPAPEGQENPKGPPKRSLPEAVRYYAFEEGPAPAPKSGLLYFAWKGKVASLKSIEIIYEGPAGKTVARLR